MTKSFNLVTYLNSTIYEKIPLSELLRQSQMSESELQAKLSELPNHLYSYDHSTELLNIHPTIYEKNRIKERRIKFIRNMVIGIGLILPAGSIEYQNYPLEAILMPFFVVLAFFGFIVILNESWHFLGPGGKRWDELVNNKATTS